MNDAKPIPIQAVDPKMKDLTNPNNNTPFQRKTVLIKFSPAKIVNVTIQLSTRIDNIIAELSTENTNSKEHKYIKMDFYCQERNKYTYNAIVDSNRYFTLLKCQVQIDKVGFYSISVYGIEAPKQKQTKLDNFLLKPTHNHNDNGSFQHFTNAITQNKDPAGRSVERRKVLKLQEKDDLEQAIEKSLIDQQFEEIQLQQYDQQIAEEESFEIMMQKEQQLQEQQFQEEFQEVDRNQFNASLGYTDNKQPQRQFGLKAQKPQFNNMKHNDQIKLFYMIRYNAQQIDQRFLQEHTIWEQSKGRKKEFLKDVMYKN